jgi:hypothetical protein
MKIGFFGINVGIGSDVDAMIRIAQAAEQAGLESVWPHRPAGHRRHFLTQS